MGLFAVLALAWLAAPMQGSLVSPDTHGEPRARIEITPDHAQVGEPFELVITVEHAAGATLTWPAPDSLPRSLAFVSDLGMRRSDDTAMPGRKITRARWRVMALEGGELALPALQVIVEEGSHKSTLDAVLPKVVIATALQPDEDAPRPLRGMRDTPRVHALSVRGVITGVSVCVLAGVVSIVLLRRRARAKPTVTSGPTPIERLAAIEQRAKSEPESVRDLTFALTHLVREAVDAHVMTQRTALTDTDWVLAVGADERLPSEARRAATQLLNAAERVKYAQESPSLLTFREWLATARTGLDALDAPRSAA